MSPWALCAVVQALAVLLGLVSAAYVWFHERGELSLDYLQRKQASIAQRLAAILPALAQRFGEFESSEPYWRETYRHLCHLALALTRILPDTAREELTPMLARLAPEDETDALAADTVARLVDRPEAFFLHVLNLSKLAPLEEGYPQRSVLNAFRREYNTRYARHVQAVQRAEWLSRGPGRVLPAALTVTLVFSCGLLLFTESALTSFGGLWGRNVLCLLLLLCVGSLNCTMRRLLQPAGKPLRLRNIWSR